MYIDNSWIRDHYYINQIIKWFGEIFVNRKLGLCYPHCIMIPRAYYYLDMFWDLIQQIRAFFVLVFDIFYFKILFLVGINTTTINQIPQYEYIFYFRRYKPLGFIPK